ncbi:hypothetical protein ABIB57_002791 [Devosia sp. UYZn731]|uniref:hypothetical protein n=1 Tax=Devosia sp. UYZn731 TaxID=3156345 RepID=UPI00339153B9
MRLIKLLQLALIALGLTLGGLAPPVTAQDANTRVIVPDVPGGALLSGCYRVTERLYGPYRMEFCLEQRGTYPSPAPVSAAMDA